MRRLAIATAGVLAMALPAMPPTAQAEPRPHGAKAKTVVGFVVGEPTLRARQGGAQVAVPVLSGRQRTWAVTEVVPDTAAQTIQSSVHREPSSTTASPVATSTCHRTRRRPSTRYSRKEERPSST